MNELQKILVETVREEMRERNMSQATLATLAGISQKHLSQMLAGKASGSLDVWNTLLKILSKNGWEA